MEDFMTKIDIISGFLGAGKTTLIKKLLQDAFVGEKVVLIENEFGEIGIDGGFLKEAGIEITEMNSGCICCSLVGDFGKSLKEVLDKFNPDRIIIEPSGVGKLSDVIKAVKDVKAELPQAELNSFSAVVDVTKAKIYMKNFGEFFNNQVESAKTIILSRTQKCAEAKLDAVLSMLKEHNEKAIIITTPWDELDGKVILAAMEQKTSLEQEVLKEECPVCGHHHHHEHEHHHDHGEECCCGHDHHDHEHEHHHEHGEECCCGHDHHEHDHEHHHEHGEECSCGPHHEHEHHHEHGVECGCGHHHEHGHHHHHADEVFASWGVETPHKYAKETMNQILEKLADTEEYGVILRAKGMVPDTEGGWIYFDLVPGEYELRAGEADYTGRLCVIGTKLQEEKLKQLFELV